MKKAIRLYKKQIFVCLGFICLTLGIIGAILPVMPTVPFLFVAYFFFKRGSRRIRNWYENSKFHKQYKKSVDKFLAMPLSRKILYILGLVIFFSALFYLWYYLYVNYADIVIEFFKNIFSK